MADNRLEGKLIIYHEDGSQSFSTFQILEDRLLNLPVKDVMFRHIAPALEALRVAYSNHFKEHRHG